VDFFGTPFQDFDAGRLAFSRFLGCLFREVARYLQQNPSLVNPKNWRDWLERPAEARKRKTLYCEVIAKVDIDVCANFLQSCG
jgi:hypothetical protein